LHRGELAALVDRCQACGQDADCTGWLASHVTAETLPDFCANKDGIEALVPR
jgi:hypothetical protein